MRTFYTSKLQFINKVRYIITGIFDSASNEGDVHGNGEDVADNEQRSKIANATLSYLEHLHKLLLDPPQVRAALNTFLCRNFFFLNYIFKLLNYHIYFKTTKHLLRRNLR